MVRLRLRKQIWEDCEDMMMGIIGIHCKVEMHCLYAIGNGFVQRKYFLPYLLSPISLLHQVELKL